METSSTHWVLVADEAGMASIFPELKDKCFDKTVTFITLVYYAEHNKYSFRQEIDILKQHYPGKFIAFYEVGLITADFEFDSQILETIINVNTCPKIRFLVSGCEEFSLVIEETLHFLGINEITFREQFFKNN